MGLMIGSKSTGVEQHPVLHWTKDVIMKKDECGIRKNKPAGTLGILRNIAFNLLKLTGKNQLKNQWRKCYIT